MFPYRLYKVYFLIFLSFLCHSSNDINIILDLGGVAVSKSTFASCREIGLSHFFGFYNPFSLEKNVFEFLSLIEPRNTETPLSFHGEILLPQIMCDYLRGLKKSSDIRIAIEEYTQEHQKFFKRSHKRKLVRAITNFIFTPESMIKSIYPIKETCQVIKHCYNKKNPEGNRTHHIYILSNWDAESFPLLQIKIPKIFKYTDGVVISGTTGLMKPDPAIFHHLFETFKINPDTELTVFIDDQIENIEAANRLGKKRLKTIHCNHPASIKKELKKLGIW